MGFQIRYRYGGMEVDPPLARLATLIGELNSYEDDEHPDVEVSHESGWGLSAFPSGLVVWENDEEQGDTRPYVRHMDGVTRERLLELFHAVARGDLAMVEQQPWLPGYR